MLTKICNNPADFPVERRWNCVYNDFVDSVNELGDVENWIKFFGHAFDYIFPQEGTILNAICNWAGIKGYILRSEQVDIIKDAILEERSKLNKEKEKNK